MQVGMRVVSINEKAAVSSQSHHRKTEARLKLNSWAPASPAQQGGSAGLPGRQGGPPGCSLRLLSTAHFPRDPA